MAAFVFGSRQFGRPFLVFEGQCSSTWRKSGSGIIEPSAYLLCKSMSTAKHPIIEHSPTEKESHGDANPMVVLYGWLFAKSNHLKKFGKFYNRYGADVVTVKPSLAEAFRPKKAEEVAGKILDTLQLPNNRNKPILIHGFSMGGYLYSQTLNKMVTDREYSSVQDRIIGQIFDSPTFDCHDIAHRFSNAATSNELLKSIIKLGIKCHLALTRKYTMDQYLARAKLFYENPVRSPALFLYSNDDPIASPEACERCVSTWKSDLGMDVISKKWDSSPHVSHFYNHQEEYTTVLVEFLKKVGVFEPSLFVDGI